MPKGQRVSSKPCGFPGHAFGVPHPFLEIDHLAGRRAKHCPRQQYPDVLYGRNQVILNVLTPQPPQPGPFEPMIVGRIGVPAECPPGLRARALRPQRAASAYRFVRALFPNLPPLSRRAYILVGLGLIFKLIVGKIPSTLPALPWHPQVRHDALLMARHKVSAVPYLWSATAVQTSHRVFCSCWATNWQGSLPRHEP